MSGVTPEALGAVLPRCWSAETSSGWRPDDPARGQCDVTALVVQALLGGEILKTPLHEGWHFYNRIAGIRHDLTAGQFATPPDYQDLPSSRAQVLASVQPEQLRILTERVSAALEAARG